jgi:thymidine kinase
MFSGKTGRLIDLLEAADRTGRPVVSATATTGDRNSTTSIVSHDGRRRRAVGVRSSRELRDVLAGASLAGFDEAQFLDTRATAAVGAALDSGTEIIAAGLDLDFRGAPFPTTELLIARATTVERRVGICGVCGAPATHTQRLVGRIPAPLDGPTVLVGGPERYSPRCERCFWAERNARGPADADDGRLPVKNGRKPREHLRDLS